MKRGEPGAELAGDLLALADVLHQPGRHLQLVDGPDDREAVPLDHVEAVGVAEAGVAGVGVPSDQVLRGRYCEVGLGWSVCEPLEVDEQDRAVGLLDQIALVRVTVYRTRAAA